MLNRNFEATVFLENAIFFKKFSILIFITLVDWFSICYISKFDKENFSKFFKICPLLVEKKSTVGGAHHKSVKGLKGSPTYEGGCPTHGGGVCTPTIDLFS